MKSRWWRSYAKQYWDLAGGVSVRTKIFGIVLGSTILLSLGFTIQVQNTQRNLLEQKSQEQGQSIARDVAARATDLILVHDFYSLHQLLAETQNNYQDVRYVFITDPEGEVLAHTFGSGFPFDLASVNNVLPDNFHRTVKLSTDEGAVWDVAVPIFEGKAGIVRVGISDQSVQATMARLTSQLLLTMLGVLALSLIAASFLTWILTRPILDLVGATRSVARGDFSLRVRRWANDEIGDLAAAFNQMTIELGKTDLIRNEREQLRRKLLEGIIDAQEEERKRIARELHDSTSQSLTSLMVSLRNAEIICDEPDLQVQVADMRSVVRNTLNEVHNIAINLRPEALDDLGLEAALTRFVKDWQRSNQIPTDLMIHLGEERLPESVEITLYRIVQESLTNVSRHARASNVSVVIEKRAGDIIAVIEDDGVGISGKHYQNNGHLGLIGIEERAQLLGGQLTIETDLNKGTSVFVSIPLKIRETIT